MIVPKGTRVVTTVSVAAAQHARPPGAVGQVVDAPTDARHAYRVRLADGFETSLKRAEFALLNEVKAMPGPVDALADRDLKDHVISQVKKFESRRLRGLEPNWRHAMHLVRLLHAGITILRDHTVPVAVGDRRDELLAIRRGDVPWPERLLAAARAHPYPLLFATLSGAHRRAGRARGARRLPRARAPAVTRKTGRRSGPSLSNVEAT